MRTIPATLWLRAAFAAAVLALAAIPARALDRYAIEGTPKTPTISLNPDGILEIRGRSIPENSVDFYQPVLQWLDEYAKDPARRTRLDLAFSALSPDSFDPLLAAMKKLESIHKGGSQVSVNWYYEQDDEDMRTAGTGFSALVELPFKFHAVATATWDYGLPAVPVAILGPCPSDASAGRVADALETVAKERGITINTSHVEYRVISCADRGGFLDEAVADPGFAAAVLVGSNPDVGTLADAAQLAAVAGVPTLLVVVQQGLYDAAELAGLVKLLAGLGYPPDTTPVFESNLEALRCAGDAGVEALFDALQLVQLPPRDKDKPFLMPVEEVKATPRGTVATGRIETGVIQVGDPVEIVGYRDQPLKSTVTGIEMFRKILDRGEAGDNVGLALRGIEKKDIRRGMVLAAPGSVSAHATFKAEVYVLKKEEGGRHTPFQNKYRPMYRIRTADVEGELTTDAGTVPNGALLEAQVELINPIAMDKGLRFLVREGGRTVGAGQVIEIVK